MVDTATKKSTFIRFHIFGVVAIGLLFSIEEMSLELAIEYALEHSTAMKLALEDKKIAYSQSVEARSAALPMLSGIVSGSRNFMIAEQVVKFGDQPPVSIKFGMDNQAVYGLSATQTIFEGRVFSAIRASKIYDKIIESSYEGSTLSVEEQTKTAYYNTLVAIKVVDVMNASLDRAKSNLEKTLLIYSMGKTSELDKIRSETNVAQLESDLVSAEKNSEIAVEFFKKTIGFPVSEKLFLTGTLHDGASMEYEYDTLEKLMLANQPAITQASQTTRLMKENISAVRSEFMPSLFLSGSYQSIKTYNDGKFADEDFRNSHSVSLNLNIPIFKGFGSSARLQKAKGDHLKSQYRQHDLLENMQLELKSIMLSIKTLDKKLILGEKELELALKGRETSVALLESGRISQLDMEDAELTLLKAELGLLQYKLDYQTSMAALYRLIGRKDLNDENKN